MRTRGTPILGNLHFGAVVTQTLSFKLMIAIGASRGKGMETTGEDWTWRCSTSERVVLPPREVFVDFEVCLQF